MRPDSSVYIDIVNKGKERDKTLVSTLIEGEEAKHEPASSVNID